jgi:GntR family transcriptional regulator/MocR family aminotransferase
MIQLKRDSDLPLHRQIADAMEKAIAGGAFRAQRNLPSVRSLATRLSVSPATVSNAYRALVERRVVEARARSGYRILAAAGNAERKNGDRAPFPLHRIEPSLTRHPVAEFGRIVAAIAAESPETGGYEDYRGYAPLRSALAELFQGDGIYADPEGGLLVSNGAQHAFALIARAAGASARVAIEDPVYPGARLAFANAGAEIVPIPMTLDGPDIDALEAKAKQASIDLFYCCPSYGNPSGRSWSVGARERVLRAAARYGFAILEDDFLGDLDYLQERLPRLASDFPQSGARVIYVRTFSKCLLPALRIAGIASDRDTIERLLAVKTADDICGSAFLQRALDRYLEGNRYQTHLERVRPHYRAVREAIREQCKKSPSKIQYEDPPAGLCLSATLPGGMDSGRFSEACRIEGVLVSPGSAYWMNPERGANSFRVGFGNIEPEDIGRAFGAIERALDRTRALSAENFFKQALL